MLKRILIAFMALLLLVPPALLGILVYTEQGVRMIEARLAGLAQKGIRIEGISGTLAGPLRVARFELDHHNVHIIGHDIVMRPQIFQLLLQTIYFDSFTAHDLLVEMRRSAVVPNPNPRPLRFLPAFLRVNAQNVTFTKIRYVNLNGSVIEADSLQGSTVLTPRQIRVGDFKLDAAQFNASGQLRLQAQRPLALELSGDGRWRLERGIELLLRAELSGTTAAMGIKAQLRQPSRVNADVMLTQADNAWRIAGQLTSPHFSMTPWVQRPPPFSLRDIALDVDMRPDNVRIKGQVRVPEVDSRAVLVEANGRFAQRVLAIDASEWALQDSPTRVRVAGTIAFSEDAQTVDMRAQWNDLQWPLRDSAVIKSASGDLALQGAMPYRYQLAANVVSERLPSVQGAAQGVLSTERLSVDHYNLNMLDGVIAGNGSLQWAQPRAWTLNAKATAINPAHLYPQFDGSINIGIEGKGRGLDRHALFALQVSGLSGRLREQSLRGGGFVERNAAGWKVRDGKLDLGSARLSLNGTLGDTIDASWALHAPSLQQLLPQAQGSIRFTGTANGKLNAPRLVTRLQAENLAYAGWRAATLAIDGDIDAAGGNPSQLSIIAASIGGSKPSIDSLRITGAGVVTKHTVNIDMTGHAPASIQPPKVRLQLAGAYADETWTATVNSTELDTRQTPQLTLAEPARLVASRDRWSLDPLCLVIGKGRLCSSGRWQRRGPWEAIVSGYEIPLAMVLPRGSDDTEYAGRIEGRVRAFGAAGMTWQGEAGMRIVDAAVIYRPPGVDPETLNLGTGGIAATASNERLDFSLGLQAFADTFVYANAQIQRNGSNDLLRQPLVGDVRARVGDTNILPIVFSDIDHAAGVLAGNARIRGTLAAPQLEGRIELTQGELDSYRVNLALRELNVMADFGGDQLDFKGSGRAGDGILDVGGEFDWREGGSRGELQLQGKDLLIADLPEYRVIASPDLKFAIDGQRIDVTGDVNIPYARIQPADLTGAVQASEDARYLGETPAERRGQLVVSSDVRITMGEDVRVDAFGLQGLMSGNVATTIRTGQPPSGRGELRVLDGRYEAYGQKLDIARGRLFFEGSSLDDPGIDVEARRKVEAVEVGLNVRGTLQSPRLSFFSQPSMPQSQIVSYLLVGKPLEAMQSGDKTTMASARDALTAQGGGLLASRLGRRLGLEEVGVESNTDEAGSTNTSLVLGKFLSPRLFISYGISLTESINTLKLRYSISDRLILKTEAGENQSADVEYTIER